MKIHWKRIALFIALNALCAVAQDTPPPTHLPVGSATVADLKGEVAIHTPKGDALVAQRGLVLDPESKIETHKGSILLNLEDGSQILMKPNSHVVLKSPEVSMGLYLELLLGKLMAKVQKRLGEAPAFRMGTPSAVITVRGTRFEVEVTKKKRTYIEVFEGIVEVQGLVTGGRAVLVRPGFSTGVDLEGDPQAPRNRAEEMSEFEKHPGNPRGREMEGSQREAEHPEQEQTKQPEKEDRPE
jgi:ferric-dicitrate binding protein FerR (iron transport regulator)